MPTILIIEDEPLLRWTLSERLLREGFRVQTAANGEDGLRQIQAHPPDLVLCDIMMPGVDGYEVLRVLRAEERTAALPFIFLTAKANPPEVRAGMALGADDYLCKPVVKADLLSAIRTRLAKHERHEKAVAREVEAARLDVVRRLPHELLTPLSALLSVGQLLESTEPGEPITNVRELGRTIRLGSQRLHRTVRRFLLYAELAMANRNPAAQTQLRGTDYLPTLNRVTDLAEHLAREDARSDDLQLDVREIEVAIDPAHFGELVGQLVDNAFKFSPPGSVVQVRLSLVAGGGCEFEVRDQGRGLTPEQVSQIGAFRQFDVDLWAQPGNGLGLALVQLIASLYSGEVTVTSEPGNGTRVVVFLPRARAGYGSAGPKPPAQAAQGERTRSRP